MVKDMSSYVIFVANSRHGQDRLMTNISVFCMAIFGDGATIVNIPIINILVCLAGDPSCDVDVTKCTEHMSVGRKMDAFYICQQMLP